MKVTINLEDYRTLGSIVFAGRDRGEEVRIASNIDTLSDIHDKVEVIVPEDIRSINPSFFEEFLINVVSDLGEDGFYNKFIFTNDGLYKIKNDLEEAVETILREEHALV